MIGGREEQKDCNQDIKGRKFNFPPRALILFALAALVVLSFSWRLGFSDDVYIFFRIADNIVSGHGPVFNPGERVEGYTSPLWLGLLTAFRFARIPADIAVRLLSSLFLILLIGAAYKEEKHGWISPILIICSAPIMAVAGNGLETGMIIWLLAAGAGLHLRGAYRASSVCFSLLALTRPEGIAVAGLAWLDHFRRTRRFPLVDGLIMGIPWSAYMVFRILYFGDFVPNTYYIKVQTTDLILASLPSLLTSMFFFMPVFIVLFGYAVYQSIKDRNRLFVAVVAGFFLVYVLRAGEVHRSFRYLMPALPLLICYTAPKIRLKAIYLLIAISVISSCIFGMRNFAMYREANDRFITSSLWLADQTHPGESLAVLHIGAVGHCNPEVRIDDLLGLTDPHIAKMDMKKSVGFHGHQKYDIEYSVEKASDNFFFYAFGSLGSNGELDINFISPQARRFIESPIFRNKYKLSDFYLESGQVRGLLFSRREAGKG
jgi:arabinofuranosyltransferase